MFSCTKSHLAGELKKKSAELQNTLLEWNTDIKPKITHLGKGKSWYMSIPQVIIPIDIFEKYRAPTLEEQNLRFLSAPWRGTENVWTAICVRIVFSVFRRNWGMIQFLFWPLFEEIPKIYPIWTTFILLATDLAINIKIILCYAYSGGSFLNLLLTWNYIGSGHGKRTPDGMGDCVKITANRLVAQTSRFGSLDDLLEKNCLGKTFKVIQEYDIEALVDRLTLVIKPFRGIVEARKLVLMWIDHIT